MQGNKHKKDPYLLLHGRFVQTFGSKNGKYPRTGKPQGPGNIWVEESSRSQIVLTSEKQFVITYKVKYKKYFLASQAVANTKHSTIITKLKWNISH